MDTRSRTRTQLAARLSVTSSRVSGSARWACLGLCWLPLGGGCALSGAQTTAGLTGAVAMTPEDRLASISTPSPAVTGANVVDERVIGNPANPIRLVSGEREQTGAADMPPTPLVGPVVEATVPTLAPSAAETAPMTLMEFETLALANNPTLRQLAATTQKASGFRTQVGLRPNPIVGYQAMQLADEGTDQHVAFVEQEFVTAGKLGLNRRVLNETLRAQLYELEAQRYRVITDIRLKFTEALAAQQQIDLITNFKQVTDKGFELAELRKQAAEGSRIDVLQSKVQKNEIELALQQAQIRYRAAWKGLTAIAGTPQLEPATLSGTLPESGESIDWNGLSTTLLSQSPEYDAAQARVSEARARLARHNVQAIPNVTVQLAAGVDNSTNSGMLNLQVGAPIPVFNWNQGNIAAAQAEYCRAIKELERIENAIRARMASVSNDFDSAKAAVDKYATEILPSAEETLQLAEQAYQAGETDFLQVLFVRRTFFETNLQYLASRTQLAQAQAKLDGFVLSGALDPITDQSGDTSLRDLTLSQQ